MSKFILILLAQRNWWGVIKTVNCSCSRETFYINYSLILGVLNFLIYLARGLMLSMHPHIVDCFFFFGVGIMQVRSGPENLCWTLLRETSPVFADLKKRFTSWKHIWGLPLAGLIQSLCCRYIASHFPMLMPWVILVAALWSNNVSTISPPYWLEIICFWFM